MWTGDINNFDEVVSYLNSELRKGRTQNEKIRYDNSNTYKEELRGGSIMSYLFFTISILM